MKSILLPLNKLFNLAFGIIFLSTAISPSAHAATLSRSLDVNQGWSAVWLDSEPVYQSGTRAGETMTVGDFFSNPAVTVVARPDVPVGNAEFVANGVSGGFQQDGWAVWRRSSALAANTLATMRGNRAYLIKSDSAHTLNFTARVSFFRPNWVPASYNLVGFGLDRDVSFNHFFDASNGVHPAHKIFRLATDGSWNNVRGSDLMTPGEAYWIFATRSSNYMGPVAVGFPGSETTGTLDFGHQSGDISVPNPQGGDDLRVTTKELTFTNLDGASTDVSLVKVDPPTSGGDALNDDLRLYHIVPHPGSLDYTVGPGSIVDPTPDTLATLSADASRTITLGSHRNWTSGDSLRENVYRIEVLIGTSGAKQQFWLPASAGRSDLLNQVLGTPAAGHAGLWLGEALINQVTSLTEEGNPLRPTTSAAPFRLLIHVNSSGTASLLGHVVLMREKTADPTAAQKEVLVINESKIPFFEGIELRAGKRVGRRFETTSYDLPRKSDTTTQVDLVDTVASALSILPEAVTADGIMTFLDGQDSRPPELVEDYHLSWPLDGGLQPGTVLRSVAATPLYLDPFHRSNPFRHAFHPRHGAGSALTRSFTITIDEQLSTDVLTGSFSESISGLIAQPLTSTGPLTLQRISTVGELQ